MELVLQLALLQKPATFLLEDGSLAAVLKPSGKAMVKALNAARATGYAILAYQIADMVGATYEEVTGKLDGMLGELKTFMSMHSLHEGELRIEAQNNVEEDVELPGLVIGSIKVICIDHPSQLLASKANQKTQA